MPNNLATLFSASNKQMQHAQGGTAGVWQNCQGASKQRLREEKSLRQATRTGEGGQGEEVHAEGGGGERARFRQVPARRGRSSGTAGHTAATSGCGSTKSAPVCCTRMSHSRCCAVSECAPLGLSRGLRFCGARGGRVRWGRAAVAGPAGGGMHVLLSEVRPLALATSLPRRPAALRHAHHPVAPRAARQRAVLARPLLVAALVGPHRHAVRHLAPPRQQHLQRERQLAVSGRRGAPRSGADVQRSQRLSGGGGRALVAAAPGSMQCTTAGWCALCSLAASMKLHMLSASLDWL